MSQKRQKWCFLYIQLGIPSLTAQRERKKSFLSLLVESEPPERVGSLLAFVAQIYSGKSCMFVGLVTRGNYILQRWGHPRARRKKSNQCRETEAADGKWKCGWKILLWVVEMKPGAPIEPQNTASSCDEVRSKVITQLYYNLFTQIKKKTHRRWLNRASLRIPK